MKIRKIISLVVIALFVAGSVYAATPGYRLSPGIGENKTTMQGGTQSDPGKTFRMVRYVPAGGTGEATDTTLVAGSIVIWDLVSDDGVTVTTTTTSYDSAVAGIIVQAALTPVTLSNTAVQDRGGRNWTWLQTHGLSEVRIQTDSSTVTAGDALATGDVAGEAADFLASASDAGANGNAGFFYDTGAAAADNVECFIKCE